MKNQRKIAGMLLGQVTDIWIIFLGGVLAFATVATLVSLLINDQTTTIFLALIFVSPFLVLSLIRLFGAQTSSSFTTRFLALLFRPFREYRTTSRERFQNIITLANRLRNTDSLEAIEQLAQLSRDIKSPFAPFKVRLAIGQAIAYRKKRNYTLTSGHGHLAVCRDHLARFRRYTFDLPYWQEWHYWQCPIAHSDKVFTGVGVIRGVFDQNMEELVIQREGLLIVNLIAWVDNQFPSHVSPDLDEVLIVGVPDQYKLEHFIVRYTEIAQRRRINLKRIRLKISTDMKLDEAIERMLRKTFEVL